MSNKKLSICEQIKRLSAYRRGKKLSVKDMAKQLGLNSDRVAVVMSTMCERMDLKRAGTTVEGGRQRTLYVRPSPSPLISVVWRTRSNRDLGIDDDEILELRR